MSIVVKYKGIQDTPILNAGVGRYPSVPPVLRGELALTGSASELFQAAAVGSVYEQVAHVEQQRVLSELKSRFQGLGTAIDNLQVPDSGPLGRARTALSSQPGAVWATAQSQATAPAAYDMGVTYAAEPKEIRGSLKNPIGDVELAAGSYDFSLTIDGTEHQLSVKVDPDDAEDTNEDMLRRLARAINGVDESIHAEVEQGFMIDSADQNAPLLNRAVRLVVSTTESGAGVNFYFGEDSSGVVAAYGLNSGLPGRQATYSTGGQTYSQGENSVSLDNGQVSAELYQATRGSADIDVGRGAGPVTTQLNDIVNRYNELISYLDLHSDLARPSLKDRLSRSGEQRYRNLLDIGLRQNAAGYLVDQGFQQAMIAAYDSVYDTMLGQDGWISALGSKVDQILEMDTHYWMEDLGLREGISPEQKAWALLFDINQNIVNGYY